MKLVLIEDVPNLGALGDSVVVKDGYARNFLIPKGKALPSGDRASKELKHRLYHLKKLREGKIKLAKDQADKIKKLNLEIIRKAGPGGRLFGSVTNRDLINLLKDNGFVFERRSLILESPIRSLGVHEFILKVHTDVKVKLNIKVNDIIKTDTVVDEKSEDTNKNDNEPKSTNNLEDSKLPKK